MALTRQTVVDGAMTLAEQEGLAAVTIRRLAERLEVTPMAIYWHVRNKQELLDAMAARVFEDVDVARAASPDPAQQLRSLLRSLLEAVRAHATIAPLLTTHTVDTEAGLRVTEALLDSLRRRGLSPQEATGIARLSLTILVNLVVSESGVVSRSGDDRAPDQRQRARRDLEALPNGQYPRLVEAAGPLCEAMDPEAYLAIGLDLLIGGIDAVATRPGRAG